MGQLNPAIPQEINVKSKTIKADMPEITSKMSDITESAKTIMTAVKNLTDENLISLNKEISTSNKNISDNLLLDRYAVGMAITADDFKKIEAKVEPDSVIRYVMKIPTYTDETKIILKPQTEWVEKSMVKNAHAVKMARALKTDTLDENGNLQFRHYDSTHKKAIETGNVLKHVGRANKSAIKTEQYARELKNINAEMKKRELKTASLKEMFEKQFGHVIVTETS